MCIASKCHSEFKRPSPSFVLWNAENFGSPGSPYIVSTVVQYLLYLAPVRKPCSDSPLGRLPHLGIKDGIIIMYITVSSVQIIHREMWMQTCTETIFAYGIACAETDLHLWAAKHGESQIIFYLLLSRSPRTNFLTKLLSPSHHLTIVRLYIRYRTAGHPQQTKEQKVRVLGKLVVQVL